MPMVLALSVLLNGNSSAIKTALKSPRSSHKVVLTTDTLGLFALQLFRNGVLFVTAIGNDLDPDDLPAFERVSFQLTGPLGLGSIIRKFVQPSASVQS